MRSPQSPAGWESERGGGTLFTEPVLVVERPDDRERPAAILDQRGGVVGEIVPDEPAGRRVRLRLGKQDDTRGFDVRDAGQSTVLRVAVRHGGLRVLRADGTPIGEIVPEEPAEGVRLALLAGQDRPIGEIVAPSWPAEEFAVLDGDGHEIAVTSADQEPGRCRVVIHRPLLEPLASITLAAVLTAGSVLERRAGRR